jgi:hypothetical protein
MLLDSGVKARWVAALRSGKYEQGFGCLRRDDRYCCLGVLCDVAGGGEWIPPFDDGLRPYNAGTRDGYGTTALPPSVMMRYDISIRDEAILIDANDEGKSFADIADLIEEIL